MKINTQYRALREMQELATQERLILNPECKPLYYIVWLVLAFPVIMILLNMVGSL